MFKFGQDTLVTSRKVLAFPVIGTKSAEIVEFFIVDEDIPTLIGLNFMGSLGTEIKIEEGHKNG